MAMAYSRGFDIDNLKQSLFRKASILDENMEVAIEKAADIIVEEAQINVPVDTHNLETAIHKSNRLTRRGNHAVDIEVSGEGIDGRDVAEYAMEVHENYQSYTPGPATVAKRAEHPDHFVGDHYLSRAVEEKKAEAVDVIRKAVKEAMSK